MGMLSSAKDRIIEKFALAHLNGTLLAPYGRATSVRIDSTARTLSIEAQLNGEPAPLRIEIAGYEISKEGSRYFAKVQDIRTSREWLSVLAANRLRNVPFELPSRVGRLLMRALH